eukprot:gene11874-14980_t
MQYKRNAVHPYSASLRPAAPTTYKFFVSSNLRSHNLFGSLLLYLFVLSYFVTMHGNAGQDWNPVVIRKKPQGSGALKDEAAVNAARRSGAAVDTVKKVNHQQTSTGKSAAKLDAETEDFKHEKVSSNLKTQIVQARTAKKLTQAQLAQLMNEKPQVIQEYESGKAIPNPQILSKMSRVLGVVLKK